VRPSPNLDDAAIDALGWRERIDRHGLAGRIAGTNLLPHGGGYTYPALRGVTRVIQRGPDDRRFELAPADPTHEALVVETPRDIPSAYRGMEVKERMEQLNLGRAVVELELAYVLTA